MLVIAVFVLALVALGGGMGEVELSIWLVAQLAALTFVILRYRRQRRHG
ncbi:hypothetical protein ACIPJS_05655 [Streptomyces sp. NPDC086783]